MLLVRFWVSVGEVGGFGAVVCVRGDGHEGRPDDAVAESVAAPDLLDDRALGLVAAGDVGDRLVLARVEVAARRRIDRGHALTVEQEPELAIARGDALEPRVVRERPRSR